MIYVSQCDSIVILKVTLTFTGAKLKEDVKPFITMPEGRVVQDWFTAKNPIISLWPTLRKMEESHCLANEEPTYVKRVSNNTATCSRVYSLTDVDSGGVYFSDVDARKVGRLTGGVKAEYVIGSAKQKPCDGCQKTALFIQPACICAEGNSLYITDPGAGVLKLISPTGAIANFLQQVRTRNSLMTCTNFDCHSPYGRCYTVL